MAGMGHEINSRLYVNPDNVILFNPLKQDPRKHSSAFSTEGVAGYPTSTIMNY
jgi:hypothetical protein